MGVVSTGIQITRAVKSAGRLRQIIAIFSKHGFGDVIDRLHLGHYVPNRLLRWSEAESNKTVGERLRESFEQLGPTFVKLGQILSMRPDLVPEGVIQELTKLQDAVQTIPYSEIKGIIEAELKRPLGEVFLQISEEPLASASIGQVHVARLLTGEEVVVKVQRPDIRRVIETDIALMDFLAEMLEKYFPELRVLNPKIFVEEFFKSLQHELDFKIEANNIEKIGKNLQFLDGITLPKVYKEYGTHQVLVMERLHGIKLNDKEAVQNSGVDLKKIAQVGTRAFLYSVLKFGFFHGDLHGGNLFIMPDGKLGIIDFGIVGRLSKKSRDQLATMMWALIQEDYETLCFTYAELGAVDTGVDFDSFQREVRNTLSPYLGLSLSEVNTGRILIDATKVAAKYRIRVPGDWMLVFRALVTMEGMGRQLDPNFDMIAAGQELIKDIIKIQYSLDRLTNDSFSLVKEVTSLLQVLPRSLRWALRKFAHNDYAFEMVLPDLQKLSKSVDLGTRRISKSLNSVGFLIAGALVIGFNQGHHWGEYPALGIILLALGIWQAFKRK